MSRRLCAFLVALVLVAGVVPLARAAATAVGPVNRLIDAGANGSDAYSDPLFSEGGFVTDDPEGRYPDTEAGFPLGYPLWYQDRSGLRLTLCQGGILPEINPMCSSDPVDPDDPAQARLRTGGTTFWWSAGAAIDPLHPPVAGFRAELFLGLAGAFDHEGWLTDGRQRAFSLISIRIDTPVAGTYTVIHPYGREEFQVDSVSDAPDSFEIDYFVEAGQNNPFDPDHAFVGPLFSAIGTSFLTWDDFDPTLQNNPAELRRQEPAVHADGSPLLDDSGNQVMRTIHYVGDPAIPHPVRGGLYSEEGETVHYFRVIGPTGSNIDVRTDDFLVSGRVYTADSARVAPLGAAVVTLAADVPSPQPLDAAVVFTAEAGGGSGRYEYRFLLTLPDGTQATVREYASSARWYWDAPAALFPTGTYRVTVQARNAGSTAPFEAQAAREFVRSGALPQVSMMSDETAGVQTQSLASPLDDDSEFVRQSYRDILAREVDADGLTYWAGELATANLTRAALIDRLLHSGEFNQRIAPLVRLYFAALLRLPDHEGLQYWIEAHAAGMTHAQIADLFVASPEFIAVYGTPDNGEFVTRLYLNVLQRQPDAEGLAYWTAQLDGGSLTRGALLLTFITADEYLALSADALYVAMAYHGLLQRTPDQGGFDYWTTALGQGLAGEEMIAFFLGSVEYFARFGAVPLPALVTLTPDPAAAATIGDPVTFTAAASGGSGSYEYRFLLQGPGDDAPATARDYATTATWLWETAGLVAGDYQITVQARNAGSTAEVETSATQGFTLHNPTEGVTLEAGAASPATIGADVTFTAAASGGSGSYEYRFLLLAPGSGTPATARDYASAATWEWETAGLAAGDYQITVQARNAGSTAEVEAEAAVAYTLVHPPLATLTFDTVELPADGSSFSAAVAINIDSLIVGYTGDGGNVTAARWTRTAATTWARSALAPLAGHVYSTAYGVNDSGLAVGESAAEGGTDPVAVYWPAGGSAAIPLSTGSFTGSLAAFAVNAHGVIAGEAIDASDRATAVYWLNPGAAPVALANLGDGTFSSAYAIGAGGHIVGAAQNGADGETRAVLWLPAAEGYAAPLLLAPVADQIASVAYDVDSSGVIVGEAEFADGVVRGVVWNAAGAVVDTFAAGTSAQAISSIERIAGYADALSGSDRAGLWSGNPAVSREIGVPFSQGYGVNARSQVVGVSGSRGFVATPR